MGLEKLKASLAGAGIIVVLTGLPYIWLGCCLWLLLGGFLSVIFYNSMAGRKASIGEGCLIGLYSGLIASPVTIIVSYAISPPNENQVASMGGFETASFAFVLVFTLIFTIVIFSIFATLGGLIGGAALGQNSGNVQPGAEQPKKVN